jgi:hypothetical protein
MRSAQIEAWVLSIIERVENRQPIEDFRVELKAQWPIAKDAARQIAGHANAARSEQILWLIGVDEKGAKVPGVVPNDLASWYPAIQSEFDGLAPAVRDLNVPYKGMTVVALLFDTDRAPFVVKNPAGGRVSHEVPWRENTSVRSARRSDLLRLLVPMQKLPELEILSANLRVMKDDQTPPQELASWVLTVTYYGVISDDSRVVIPTHNCECEVLLENDVSPLTVFESNVAFGLRVPAEASLIQTSPAQAILNGPGQFYLEHTARTPRLGFEGWNKKYASARITLRPVHSERPIVQEFQLEPDMRHVSAATLAYWQWNRST